MFHNDDITTKFGDLLAEACTYGINYVYVHEAKEQFQLTYKGRTWTRGTPSACRGLLEGMIRAVKQGRL